MRVTMMLCDSAQVAEGKLYILGGGWSLTGPDPTPSAIAMKLEIDWTEADQAHHWELFLEDADGHPVMVPGPEGVQPIEVRGDFQVGRPPGIAPGSPIDLPLAVNVGPLPLAPGTRYSWRLVVDGHAGPEWAVSFTTRPALPDAPPGDPGFGGGPPVDRARLTSRKGAVADAEQLVQDVAAGAAARFDEIVDLRRQLHARPELSFAETATTELIRGRLRQLGLTEEPCPTPTGAVFSLTGGSDGGRSSRTSDADGNPTVLLRADIDGLPVLEDTGLAFASQIEGTMHACGHDAHTAVLLGVAAALASRVEDLPGRYLLVFQPAEEQISGAQAMLDGGLLASEHPMAAVGWHVAAQAPSGLVLTKPGVLMAACKGIRVHMSGAGGHGALQPRTGNPVLAVARLADRLHGVVAGMAYEGTDCVCSPGAIHAGTAGNVVPTRAEMAATLRVFTDDQLGAAWARLETLVAEVAAEFEVEARIEAPLGTGAVRNDATVAARVLDVARSLAVVGPPSVLAAQGPVAASDDVSVLLDQVPGCYFFVGGGPPDRPAGMHHSPTFDVHEPALATAAAVMAGAAVSLAGTPPPS